MHIVLVQCLDEILDNCTLPDVLSVSHASKSLQPAVMAYISRRVDRSLKSWFSNRLAFRQELRDSSAIVSGSFVLALATSPSWIPRDLDVYVGSTHGFITLSHYFKEREGFIDPTQPNPLDPMHAHPDAQPPYPQDHDNPSLPQGGFANYCRLAKTVQLNEQAEYMFIDLIQTQSRHPANFVLRFPASCVMNWLTANEIVMTYPDITCNNVALLRPHCLPSTSGAAKAKEDAWLMKYKDRGFQIVATVDDSTYCTCGSACPYLQRNSYDESCRRISYGLDGWTGSRQVDPMLAWPAPWRRAKVAECPHMRCPQRKGLEMRLSSFLLLLSDWFHISPNYIGSFL